MMKTYKAYRVVGEIHFGLLTMENYSFVYLLSHTLARQESPVNTIVMNGGIVCLALKTFWYPFCLLADYKKVFTTRSNTIILVRHSSLQIPCISILHLDAHDIFSASHLFAVCTSSA